MKAKRKAGGWFANVVVMSSLLCIQPAFAEEPAGSDVPSPGAMTIEFGVFGGLFLLSEDHELYDFDSGVAHQTLDSPGPEIGLRVGIFPSRYLGGELEAALVPTSAENGDDADVYALRGHILAQLPNRLTPFFVLGLGDLGVNSSNSALGSDSDTAFHYGVGAKYYFTHLVSARVDARHSLANSLGDGITSHFEFLVGLGLTIPQRKSPDPDDDGFKGANDQCPTEAGVAPDGCPADADSDGFSDAQDACPNAAGVAPDGCPPDADGDGVPDTEDACPNEPGPANGCPDGDGDGVADAKDVCPAVAGTAANGCPANDIDGDGVLGAADRCPEVPGVAPTGCPDADQDGVPDADDACPSEPETANNYKDGDGCPDEVPQAVQKFTGAIEGIRFATGSAKIRSTSFGVLSAAVKVLKEYPSVHMEIDGHSDSTGNRERNVELSLARAEAVKAYFIQQGIAEDRLTAKGFGPDQPVESNETAAGRAKNRRIEFKLVQ